LNGRAKQITKLMAEANKKWRETAINRRKWSIGIKQCTTPAAAKYGAKKGGKAV
jgi:hypothetical protein